MRTLSYLLLPTQEGFIALQLICPWNALREGGAFLASHWNAQGLLRVPHSELRPHASHREPALPRSGETNAQKPLKHERSLPSKCVGTTT